METDQEKKEQFPLSNMDSIKLSRLVESVPSAADKLRIISGQDAVNLKNRLCNTLQLDASMEGLRLTQALQARRKRIDAPNAEAATFNLIGCLKSVGIVPGPRVYINWGRFQQVDSMDLNIVAQHFDDFWYPKADDIDLFDETFRWVLSIDCDGFAWVVT